VAKDENIMHDSCPDIASAGARIRCAVKTLQITLFQRISEKDACAHLNAGRSETVRSEHCVHTIFAFIVDNYFGVYADFAARIPSVHPLSRLAK
jgi:hypothetical protein